ncbi:hypothetical protein, partial [Geobacillus subterraneus]|uniref:hypothetical protein n=1 Tax=Geobacillus subterraneus TaxID=129338 RepID=UPI001C889CD3
ISNLPNGREKEKKKFTLLVNFFLTSDFFNTLTLADGKCFLFFIVLPRFCQTTFTGFGNEVTFCTGEAEVGWL